MSPEDIRADLNHAHRLAENHAGDTDRAIVLTLAALTEAVLHLADVVNRDRVF